MVDLSSIQTNISNFSNIAIVTPTKENKFTPQSGFNKLSKGSDALLFHIDDENTATVTSDVTDHFVEDNTSIQDHVALKPEMVTVRGYIGELNDVVPGLLEGLKTVADKLTDLGPYQPEISASALIAYNEAKQAYDLALLAQSAVASAFNTISKVPGLSSLAKSTVNINPATGEPFASGFTFPTQNKQQLMFTNLYAYWAARKLFTVQTPWAIFNNMIIMSMRATQDGETDVISDFEITFKKIRLASTVTTTGTLISTGRAAASDAEVVNLGNQNVPSSATN